MKNDKGVAPQVLIVDDDRLILDLLAERLKHEFEDWHILAVESSKEALKIIMKEDINVVLTDVRMPEISGIELLTEIKSFKPYVPVILITAYPEIKSAVNIAKLGAHDYFEKPLSENIGKIINSVRNAVEQQQLASENKLGQNYLECTGFDNIIGGSENMVRIFSLINKLSTCNTSVLICGKTGTGKELVARAIHNHGPRRNKKFTPVSCSTLPKDVIESELFGVFKGAFFGTRDNKEGLIKSSEGGTIFLDDISKVPLGAQGKLLRMLEEGKINPTGSYKTVDVNVRIIAATNVDLEDLIQKGLFRKDLYYRLNSFTIELPQLKDRPSDIPLLVDHFIKKNSSNENRKEGVEPDALNLLMNYDWPGNVRELENCIESAVISGVGNTITITDLPNEISSSDNTSVDLPAMNLKGFERLLIQKTLEKNSNCVQKTASSLNISVSTLYRKIREYSIERRGLEVV